MHEKKDRVIFDTNIWISYLISDEFSFIDTLILHHYFDLIYSEELLKEFVTVTKRKKFNRYFTTKEINSIVDWIIKFGIYIDVKSRINICRDPKDNFLLSLSYDAHATHLISGDKDLLEIKYFYGTTILEYSSYIKNIIIL